MSNVTDYLVQILTKGLKSNLSSTSVEDGKLRFTTDTNELFFDDGNVRKKVSDVITGYTDYQVKTLVNPVADKLYATTDTCRIYMYYNQSMVDVAGIIPVESTANEVMPIALKDANGAIRYNTNLNYNPSTQTFKAGPLKVKFTTDETTSLPTLHFFINDLYDFIDEEEQFDPSDSDDTSYDFGDLEASE